VGQLTYRKGIVTLADALARLPPGIAHLTVIANAIPHPELLEKLPPSSTIKVNATDSELRNAYLEHDVFVMPSYLEGSGLVYAEALGFGLPTIGTPNSCLPDILPIGMQELMVPPGDVTSLTELIALLANDHTLLDYYVEMAGHVGETLTWQNFRQEIVHSLANFEGMNR